jgi:hypothetical protein
MGKAQSHAFSTQDFEVLRSQRKVSNACILTLGGSACALFGHWRAVGTGSLCYIYSDQDFSIVQGKVLCAKTCQHGSLRRGVFRGGGVSGG